MSGDESSPSVAVGVVGDAHRAWYGRPTLMGPTCNSYFIFHCHWLLLAFGCCRWLVHFSLKREQPDLGGLELTIPPCHVGCNVWSGDDRQPAWGSAILRPGSAEATEVPVGR